MCAGPAVAQPDHLHLDLSLVACGQLKANGYELPESAKLDLRFLNAANDKVLHQATPTTGKDGSLELAKVDLTAVRTVRLTVSRPGEKPFAFSEMSIPGECPSPSPAPPAGPPGRHGPGPDRGRPRPGPGVRLPRPSREVALSRRASPPGPRRPGGGRR